MFGDRALWGSAATSSSWTMPAAAATTENSTAANSGATSTSFAADFACEAALLVDFPANDGCTSCGAPTTSTTFGTAIRSVFTCSSFNAHSGLNVNAQQFSPTKAAASLAIASPPVAGFSASSSLPGGVAQPASLPSSPHVTPAAPLATASSGRELCKFYVSGGCARGDLCPFSHELNIEAPEGVDSSKGFVIVSNVANAHAVSSPTGATGNVPLADNNAAPRAAATRQQHSRTTSWQPEHRGGEDEDVDIVGNAHFCRGSGRDHAQSRSCGPASARTPPDGGNGEPLLPGGSIHSHDGHRRTFSGGELGPNPFLAAEANAFASEGIRRGCGFNAGFGSGSGFFPPLGGAFDAQQQDPSMVYGGGGPTMRRMPHQFCPSTQYCRRSGTGWEQAAQEWYGEGSGSSPGPSLRPGQSTYLRNAFSSAGAAGLLGAASQQGPLFSAQSDSRTSPASAAASAPSMYSSSLPLPFPPPQHSTGHHSQYLQHQPQQSHNNDLDPNTVDLHHVFRRHQALRPPLPSPTSSASTSGCDEPSPVAPALTVSSAASAFGSLTPAFSPAASVERMNTVSLQNLPTVSQRPRPRWAAVVAGEAAACDGWGRGPSAIGV